MFSEREGWTPVRSTLQVEGVDELLRTAVWDVIYTIAPSGQTQRTDKYPQFNQLWRRVFRRPLDEIPYQVHSMMATLKLRVFDGPWYEIYDIVEVFTNAHEASSRKALCEAFNSIFEQHMSPYRFVDSKITQVGSDTDAVAIEEALRDSRETGLRAVHEHLLRGLELLSDRTAPDYKNSVKESISAVEAICRQLSGKPKASLSEAMQALEAAGVSLHGAQKKGWLALFGYTSDAAGIRHASDGAAVSQHEARYFLVSCSAFVSLLTHYGRAADIIR